MSKREKDRTVTFDVATLDVVKQRVGAAFKGRKQGTRRSFATLDLMHRILTANRWQILRTMMGAGPIGVRELARRLDRDVKAVHSDVHALLAAGVIDRADDGRVVFPFDAIHVDFVVKAA
jgi:predicted transcriptional regulator